MPWRHSPWTTSSRLFQISLPDVERLRTALRGACPSRHERGLHERGDADVSHGDAAERHPDDPVFSGDASTWHNVSVTYDPTTRVRALYVDGTLRGRDVLAEGLSVASETKFTVGAALATGTDRPFKGYIGDFAIWRTALGADDNISRIDALILFAAFIAFIWITLRNSKNDANEKDASTEKVIPTWKSVLFIIFGLVGLVLGSNIFVDNASSLAHGWGISDAVIGLTIVAGGTSLPELATSAVAARKGDSGIAIGNVLGSNVFNILMILGLTGIISPMHIQNITCIDMAVMVISMVLFWLFSFTKLRVERWEGCVLIACFLGYLTWLVSNV